MRLGHTFTSLAIIALVAPSVTLAQAPGSITADAGTGLEEIVVTAQRREETLQKSSLAIQAIGASELAAAGVAQAKDLNALVPGLQIGAGGTATQIYIRGVGDASSNQLANPGVAFNVDGIYIGRPQAVGTTFFDVERVEVVKGPQGTLYGRNASGGAINLITRKPVLSDFSGYVSLEAGNFSSKRGQGAVNLPIGAQLALRVAFDVADRDGYLSDGTDDDKHEAARAQLLWVPADAVSIRTSVDYAHTHGKGPGYALGSFGVNPLPRGIDPWTSGQSALGLQALASVVPLGAPLTVGMDFTPHVDSTSVNESMEVKYDTDWATLTVLPAHRDFRDDEVNFPGFSNGQSFHAKQSTLETRLNHDAESLKWVVGAYYYDESSEGDTAIRQGIVQISDYSYSKNSTQAWAGFGQLSYSIVPDMRIIAGARYTSEHRKLAGVSNTSVFLAPSPPVSFTGTLNNGSTTWKAGLEYDVTPSSMLFLTASTGFKAGGINQEPPPNLYQPEKLKAYEFGSRNRFFDDRLQVNAEVFKWEYDNHQEGVITFDNLGAPNFLVENAGAVSIKGASLDIQAKVTAYDTLRAYGEYNDASYDSFSVDAAAPVFNPASTSCATSPSAVNPFLFVTVDCAGFQLARAPRWSGSASWEHRFPLASGAQLVANANAQFASSRWVAVDFTQHERQPSYTIGNFDLTYSSAQSRWSVSAFVRNVGNKAVSPAGVQQGFAPPQFYLTLNAPRTYGGRVSINF